MTHGLWHETEVLVELDGTPALDTRIIKITWKSHINLHNLGHVFSSEETTHVILVKGM